VLVGAMNLLIIIVAPHGIIVPPEPVELPQ